MTQAYLLGIDIGTSSIKTVLMDDTGRRRAQHTYFYDPLVSHHNSIKCILFFIDNIFLKTIYLFVYICYN